MLFVVKTGLCAASGIAATSFFSSSGGELVSAAAEFVLGAATHNGAARTNGKMRKKILVIVWRWREALNHDGSIRFRNFISPSTLCPARNNSCRRVRQSL